MISIIFELLNQPADTIKSLIDRINPTNTISLNEIQNALDLIVILGLILIMIKPLLWTYQQIKQLCKENNRWRKKYLEKHILPEFLIYRNERKKSYYINTKIQSENPSKYDDPVNARPNALDKDFISHFITSVLKHDNPNRLYCLLAGSGMGKSTALVNLFISYIEYYKKSNIPFEIRLFSLANSDVLSSISKIENKNETILLLDALDENIEAVANVNDFMNKLEESCRNFRFVILSCRTQFFEDDEAQLKESKLIRDTSNKGFAAYNTFYISPFNDKEIKDYIHRVFPIWKIWKIWKRRRANSIINNKACRNLLIRPMILSHISHLVNADREYKSSIDIYDAIVDYWLEREVVLSKPNERQEKKQVLRKLSLFLAENIYTHKEERKGYYINKEDFKDFLTQHGVDKELQFRERSLINRDSIGYIKFSHKSFLEYFIAYLCADGLMYLPDFSEMDVTQTMYLELCKKLFQQNSQINGNDIVFSPFKNKKHRGEITIVKNKNFQMRWLDFLEIELIITKSSIIKDVLKDDNLLWYKNVKHLYIVTNSTNIEYVKFLSKLPSLRFLSIRGDIGMKKGKYIEKIHQKFPNITLETNGFLVIDRGVLVSNSTGLLINSDLAYYLRDTSFNDLHHIQTIQRIYYPKESNQVIKDNKYVVHYSMGND